MKREAVFQESLKNGKVRCLLCPHKCVIEEGKVGLCGVRKNVKGTLYSLNYGEISGIAMDPVEKKPLFQFRPGEEVLSIGSWGCNMKCPFCQNWQISKVRPPVNRTTPMQLIQTALEYGSKAIAYTYSEPIVMYEFMLDTARIALKEGLYNIMVTNGYIEKEPLKLLLNYIHAANIDLKAFDDKTYRKFGGDLESVKETIKYAYERGIHIELTTLVVPGDNDDPGLFEEEVRWIADIDKKIPLHITRYFPNYKYTKPSTPVNTLISFWNIAKRYLDAVYIGNVGLNSKYESTFCPNCGALVIERKGYDIKFVNFKDGACSKCGTEIVRYE